MKSLQKWYNEPLVGPKFDPALRPASINGSITIVWELAKLKSIASIRFDVFEYVGWRQGEIADEFLEFFETELVCERVRRGFSYTESMRRRDRCPQLLLRALTVALSGRPVSLHLRTMRKPQKDVDRLYLSYGVTPGGSTR